MAAQAARWMLPLLAVAALAGCTGQGASPTGPLVDVGDGSGDGAEAALLDANSTVAAPTWTVGQWWEWQATFGTQRADGTFCSIVVDGSRLLASEKDAQSKHEAAFGHPLLGPIGAGLEMQGFGGDWDVLDFPLKGGKAWTGSVPNLAWDVLPQGAVPVDFTATFDAGLQGYRIAGTTTAGKVLDATYLPATGWFGRLDIYDIDPGQEPLEVSYEAVATGVDYAGPYFLHTAKLLLELADGSGLDDAPPEGQPFLMGPQPHGSFTMAEGTLLYGALVAETVIASRVITLTDPAGGQRQVVSQGDLNGNDESLFLDEAGKPGEWRVATSGAGGYSAAYVELYELTEQQLTL